MKRFMSIILVLSFSLFGVISAMGQDKSSLDEEVNDINSYMKSVVDLNTSPFSQKNLSETNTQVNSIQSQARASDSQVSSELAISSYNLDECKQVYTVDNDFYEQIESNKISIDYNNYYWYVPVINGEEKNASLLFNEYNGNLLPISMSIQVDNTVKKVLSDEEISNILKDNEIDYNKLNYFFLPTLNKIVVSAYVQTETEEYIIIVDNTLHDSSLEVGHPYTVSELKDLITE